MRKSLGVFLIWICGITTNAQHDHRYMIARMDGFLPLPDGSTTNIWAYGYDGSGITLPGPHLQFNYGDTVSLHFRNPSPESHTIHPHGLDVDQVNDGVPQTSFYVMFGDSAIYSFVADEAGTFLYHCHVTTTLHLTMGMYGMISVNYPGDLLFQNGPHYDQEFHYLASDLEIRVNDAPLLAFPFHKIKPDHFMVNGLSGSQIEQDTSLHINVEAGESVALRLGSMAYSKVKFIFPQGSNTWVHMSDGRAIPDPYPTEEVLVYPGERFSVIMTPDETMYGDIEVQYFNMLNREYLGSNFIPVKDLGSEPLAPAFVTPNPANDEVLISIKADQEEISWYGTDGRLVARYNLAQGEHRIDLSRFAAGSYVLISDQGSQQKVIIQR